MMRFTYPIDYKVWVCSCGKQLRYQSKKQLDYELAQHNSSRRHQRYTGWSLPPLMSNEEFERSLHEAFR